MSGGKSKTISYDYEEMKRAGYLLERLTIKGMDNIRIIAEIGNILDSGILEETSNKSEKEN